MTIFPFEIEFQERAKFSTVLLKSFCWGMGGEKKKIGRRGKSLRNLFSIDTHKCTYPPFVENAFPCNYGNLSYLFLMLFLIEKQLQQKWGFLTARKRFDFSHIFHENIVAQICP